MNMCCHTQDAVNEYTITGLEAMLAGTLALMSAYAHGSCTAHQSLISSKIISNLNCLQTQASLSPEFRKVLMQVGHSWHQHHLLPIQQPSHALAPSATSFSIAGHSMVQ